MSLLPVLLTPINSNGDLLTLVFSVSVVFYDAVILSVNGRNLTTTGF